MREVELGTTGVTITTFVAGAPRAPIPVARGVDLLNEAWDLGIRAVDVRDVAAESETSAARWLDDRQPEAVILSAGIGAWVDPGRGSDLTAERIRHDLDAATTRLGQLDLPWTHGADADTPLEATLTELAAGIEAGRLRGWGVSDLDVWQLEAVLRAADRALLPRPGFVRIRLNLLERGAERDLLPLALGEGLGVVTRAPFAGGRLTDRHVDAEDAAERAAAAGTPRESPVDPALAPLRTLRDLARERELSTAALALAWLEGHPAVSATMVSPRAATEWDAVHEALAADLDDELRDRINALFA